MTQYLAFNQGDPVRLGGLTLPGVVTTIEVRGQYEIEKKKATGVSGTHKFGRGYNDAQVTITLEILPPNQEAQVKQIEAVFKGAFGAAGKPKPIRVVNPLLDSRDVTNVLFAGFTVLQGNEDEAYLGTLELLEYESLPRKQELSQRPQRVSGPRALPVPAVSATYTPINSTQAAFEGGLGTGGTGAENFLGGLAKRLGLPSNAAPTASPLPSFLSDIAAGKPVAEPFINGSGGNSGGSSGGR